MRKFLSFIVMTVVAIVPFTVSAASEVKYNCGDFDENGYRTCTVSYIIDEDTPQNSVAVKLTEHGGAEITEVKGISNSEFSINNTPSDSNGVWNVEVVSPDSISGDHDLFTFTYKESGTEDCKVTISIGEITKDVETDTQPDEEKETGATLPILALGAVVLVATGAYLTTKNKSKLYRI